MISPLPPLSAPVGTGNHDQTLLVHRDIVRHCLFSKPIDIYGAGLRAHRSATSVVVRVIDWNAIALCCTQPAPTSSITNGNGTTAAMRIGQR